MAEEHYNRPLTPTPGEEAPSDEGQVSQGPSGLASDETSLGGADSVPSTPDALPYTPSEVDGVDDGTKRDNVTKATKSENGEDDIPATRQR